MRRTIGGMLVLALTACGAGPTAVVEVLETGGPLHLVVDTASAAVARGGGGVSLPVTVENRGAAVLWIARCGDVPGFEVQRWEGGGWGVLHSGVCLTHLEMAPVRLEPGASLTGWGTVMGGGGRFRFRLAYGEEPARLDRRAASAPFELR